MICCKCNHEWRPHVKDPKCCPACKTYDYAESEELPGGKLSERAKKKEDLAERLIHQAEILKHQAAILRKKASVESPEKPHVRYVMPPGRKIPAAEDIIFEDEAGNKITDPLVLAQKVKDWRETHPGS